MKFLLLLVLFGLSRAQHNPQLKLGRTAIVHLLGWRWAGIAAECERFLGLNGFDGNMRPWWQRYQPISYNFCSRSGSEAELMDMIPRCNNVEGPRCDSEHWFTYCDVISGQKEGSRCTGKQIQVGSDGLAQFYISNTEEDLFNAIHADFKL